MIWLLLMSNETQFVIDGLPDAPEQLTPKLDATVKSLKAHPLIENVPADVVAESIPRLFPVPDPKKKNSALSAVKLDVAAQFT
jgi:hypothetical protein